MLKRLLILTAVISLVAIVTRLVWVPLATAIPRLLSPAVRRRDPMPPWSTVFFVG